jgi:hypothetical protein
MRREVAIELLVDRELEALGEDERQSLLLNWWSIDDGEAEYHELPAQLQSALYVNEPPDNVSDKLYDPLLKIALKHKFIGVINSYLESRLAKLGQHVKVTGNVEPLSPCVCCGYRTLSRIGWDVCPVCFWEEDGVYELDRISGPNHMSLREARANFSILGAVSEAHVRHVLQDGKERYSHSAD